MKKTFQNLKVIGLYLTFPLMLFVLSFQSYRYNILSSEISALEQNERAIIEQNKELIQTIGLLSAAARIEHIAIEKLGMHQAKSDEIIRVKVDFDRKRGQGGI